jgi:tetratricopeptide (TPR) repeat protein
MPRSDTAEVDALIEEILVDAYGDDEQFVAFLTAFQDALALPADAFVIGEPVTIHAVDYDGNPRRGVTATCRRGSGPTHTIALCDVVFPAGSEGARHLDAYRRWLDLPPLSLPEPTKKPKRHKAAPEDLDLDAPIALVVLAVKASAARCRVLGTAREITLRSGDLWQAVPGEIVTVRGKKQWRYGGHPYLSGGITGHRLDAVALGLVPLRLMDEYLWDPADEYWGEPDEPLEDWAREIFAHGPRRSFEMEQVLPGEDPDNYDSDPILEACDRHAGGDRVGAHKLLMDLLEADLRCLDAHAHLGNFAFDHRGDEALRHYEVGVRIGELSLGEGFDGVLPWGRIDNRPFLRCLKGQGLTLWRARRFDEARAVFERMLWLNPTDNQGVRFVLDEVRAGAPWRDEESSP